MCSSDLSCNDGWTVEQCGDGSSPDYIWFEGFTCSDAEVTCGSSESTAGSDAFIDECGVPDGDNSTCAGCDGVPNSGLVEDECGVCGGDNTTCMDECGVPNGPGAIYECGCADIPEGECDCEGTLPATGYDCNGNCLNDEIGRAHV